MCSQASKGRRRDAELTLTRAASRKSWSVGILVCIKAAQFSGAGSRARDAAGVRARGKKGGGAHRR